MSGNLRAARVAPPGAILKRELDARGWTQKELAAITKRPAQAISEIISGEKRITAETALELSRALGTSAEFWLNLESNFQLWKAMGREKQAAAEAIQRKSRMHALVPLAELQKRGWIKKASSLDVVEADVCRFLGIRSLSEEPRLAASFRHSAAKTPETSGQLAWVKRVEAVAATLKGGRYSRLRLQKAIPELLRFAETPDDAPRALEALADLGVPVAIVRHLPKTFVDGVAYERDDGRPVVGLSLRYDRLDNFWFTLLHEIAHLVLGHEGAHLDDFQAPADSAEEREANERAREWLIPTSKLDEFVARTPRMSRDAIVRFSGEIGRHPAIVVGQLRFRNVVPYSHFGQLVPKVSPALGMWVTA